MYKRVLAATVMLLLAVFLTNGELSVSYAAGKKETVKTKQVQGAESKKVFDAHATGVRYHFNDTDMDFNFGTLVLGSTVNHGVEIGDAPSAGITKGNRFLDGLSREHCQSYLLALGRTDG